MASVNKAIIVGNLGRDPELRQTNNGNDVCNLSVATTERVNDEDKTEWHRVTVWGNSATACGKYLRKGRQVYVEGRIETRSYEGKDGSTKYSTEIVVGGGGSRVQFLGGKTDDIPDSDRRQATELAEQAAKTFADTTEKQDDIPF